MQRDAESIEGKGEGRRVEGLFCSGSSLFKVIRMTRIPLPEEKGVTAS